MNGLLIVLIMGFTIVVLVGISAYLLYSSFKRKESDYVRKEGLIRINEYLLEENRQLNEIIIILEQQIKG